MKDCIADVYSGRNDPFELLLLWCKIILRYFNRFLRHIGMREKLSFPSNREHCPVGVNLGQLQKLPTPFRNNVELWLDVG